MPALNHLRKRRRDIGKKSPSQNSSLPRNGHGENGTYAESVRVFYSRAARKNPHATDGTRFLYRQRSAHDLPWRKNVQIWKRHQVCHRDIRSNTLKFHHRQGRAEQTRATRHQPPLHRFRVQTPHTYKTAPSIFAYHCETTIKRRPWTVLDCISFSLPGRPAAKTKAERAVHRTT